MSTQFIGKKEKALVHIAKAQLSMSEIEYRDLLAAVGVTSSTQLTYRQFDELMELFREAGFKSKCTSPSGPDARLSGAKEKQPMLSKIGAILADLNMPSSYADRVAKKMFGVERLRWCTSEQTWKVLQALIIFQNRRAAPRESTG